MEMTPFETKVFNVIKSAREGFHVDSSDGAHFNNACRRLETRGLVTSTLEADGCGRTYRATPQPADPGAAVVAELRKGDSIRGELFNEIVARRTPWAKDGAE